ncbi:carbohydrate-binding-like fold protein [Artemisia annua]|uniref:Carbohydrate-binding-like fold protein n=1 Tax=Artemisia annua TaxID=35608 RepID=A0A2U1M3N6_ARTAN|nr:carbohydrate-binding-like fold protein [Artemisia annua]
MVHKHHNNNYLTYFIIIISIVHVSTLVSADSIHGCGGFVESSSSLIKSRKATDSKFDYSDITVELRTLDGLVKDRTQCAPNGYYFMPVYDKGSFVIKIKGPEGWSWDPHQVPVHVDHTGCNNNEDINFRFTGFSISGKVVGAVGGGSCSSTNGGPSNVNVELLDSSGNVVSSVLTSVAGSYSFINIIPGRYMLRASHNDLNIEVKGSTEVELGFGNIEVDDIFFVSGYDIRGSVVAQGNPILGVHFYLHSDDVKEVHCPQGSGDASRDKTALCHAISDADGTFKFKSIPCGVYKLIPYYKGENTVFDVSPPSAVVTVQHDHATISEKFQVTGFSVGGRIVDSNGNGVDGVKIVLDGVEKSITDKEGYYKLDQVTSKKYQIEAKKDHYKFSKLVNLMVLPNMASVPDIKAVSYDVCGSVQTVDSGYKAKVALTHGPDNVKPQMKQTDENGYFCFEVPPGDYRLSAIAAKPDATPDLLFSPPHIDVNVNGPLMSPKFYQARVNLHGSVTCKEKCDSSISVALVRLDAKRNEKKQTVGLTDSSNEFMFQNVLPGKYKLEVKHLSEGAISGEDKWCWEQNSVPVNVGTEDVKGINFVQKGYWVNLISTHDVDAYLHQSDGSRVNLKIKKGSQNICVESPGVHELQFVNSCVLFGSSPVKIDTANTSPIFLKGEKYLLKGQIKVELSSQNGVDHAMGVVTLLSGQPKEGVSVEARSDLKGYYEETVTDSSGSYRLRGLHPDTSYTIRVVAKNNGFDNSRIERASPDSVVVNPETTLLTGSVDGNRIKEVHEHLRLEVRSASDPSKVESLSPLSLSNFFQVKGLSRGKHLLQLRSVLSPSVLRFESEVIEVDLEKNTQIHVGSLRYRVDDEHHKQELTPAPVYPLIIGVLVIALFISMPRLKDIYQSNVGVLVPGPSASTKKTVRKKTF